ncbi:hypothetical protein ACVGW9_17855, partial [Enterobacter hormaechei]
FFNLYGYKLYINCFFFWGSLNFLKKDWGFKNTVWFFGLVYLVLYYGVRWWPDFRFLFHILRVDMLYRGAVGMLLVIPQQKNDYAHAVWARVGGRPTARTI